MSIFHRVFIEIRYFIVAVLVPLRVMYQILQICREAAESVDPRKSDYIILSTEVLGLQHGKRWKFMIAAIELIQVFLWSPEGFFL